MRTLQESRFVDVISASDFRYPGGTSHSVAQEVKAQSAAGLSTGLLHIPRGRGVGPNRWSPEVMALLSLPNVFLVTRYEDIHARLLVIRHPLVIETTRAQFRRLTADKLIIVANQAAVDGQGAYYYDAARVNQRATELFGKDPLWAPISPIVRQGLGEQASEIDVLEYDWVNIIEHSGEVVTRRGFVGEKPRIGRHSRPNWPKWPSSKEEILAAYPDNSSVGVEILGGAEPAEDVLGYRPKNWNVVPFGEEAPEDFFKRIDFWVYFHHEQWREAFGRAILEAMASGAVIILPHYLEVLFGGAALYATPAEVQGLVLDTYRDPAKFYEQSRKGIDFAGQHTPQRHIARLQDVVSRSGLEFSAPLEPVSPSRGLGPKKIARASSMGWPEQPRRVLFITSNGNGIGHLTRLLSVARHRETGAESYFASMSTGAHVAGEMGFPFEYIPSWEGLGSHWRSWSEAYLEHRINELIELTEPGAIVFDGTMPYQGLLNSLRASSVPSVWMRRAMWKREVVQNVSRRAREFNLIIEPGEYATDYDQGITRTLEDSVRVDPIVLLDEAEVLSRDAAREELGYDHDGKYILVTLSSGSTNDTGSVAGEIIRWFASNKPDWHVVVTRHPLAAGSTYSDVERLQTYPLARVLRAFDGAVSACGYNSFHELLALGIPTAWVPNDSTHTDDQLGRAKWSDDSGTGVFIDVTQIGSVDRGLHRLTLPGVRQFFSENMAQLPGADGGAQAAQLLKEGI